MWGGRHCREGEGSKVEMVWTRNKKDEEEPSDTLSNKEIRRCGVANIAEKVREARLRWHRHGIRRYTGEPVKNIME
jgi:hypothetical protein